MNEIPIKCIVCGKLASEDIAVSGDISLLGEILTDLNALWQCSDCVLETSDQTECAIQNIN